MVVTNGRRRVIFIFALAIVTILFQESAFGESISNGRRARRSIGQFGNMIRLTTGMEALLFNEYGNHCGSGNSSALPVIDSIDQCCRDHDLCYESLSAGVCSRSLFGPYFIRYQWNPTGNRSIECRSSENCKLATCHCDRTAAGCLGRHAPSYNVSNKQRSIWDWLM